MPARPRVQCWPALPPGVLVPLRSTRVPPPALTEVVVRVALAALDADGADVLGELGVLGLEEEGKHLPAGPPLVSQGARGAPLSGPITPRAPAYECCHLFMSHGPAAHVPACIHVPAAPPVHTASITKGAKLGRFERVDR